VSVDFFDIIFIADPRFPGGTSTALAAEVKAAALAGLSVALKPVLSPLLRQARSFHPKLLADVAQSGAVVLGPEARADCRFAVLHHPMVFDRLPAQPLGIVADHAVVVLHHPPLDGLGVVAYDVAHILAVAELCMGCKVWLAPVGPLVRAQLQGWEASTLAVDWSNLIDLSEWPDQSARLAAPLGKVMRIGRHSRPHPPKWPATLALANQVYGNQSWLCVSMLGADAAGLKRRYGQIPAHWQLLPFGAIEVQDYLATLDAWVYFHDPQWVEAFGRAILEAAGSGLPVIVPKHFQQLFGPACIYCDPGEVADVLHDLQTDDTARGFQAQRARAHIARKFGLSCYPDRLAALDPNWAALRKGATLAPAASPPAATPRYKSPSRTLYMSSNGVGLGHLTRLLALAEAEPDAPLPMFFTLSRGAGFVRQAGYPCEFMPFHRGLDVDLDAWNDNLAQTLLSIANYHQIGTFVFDGNMPYQGILDFLDNRQDIRAVWCRRGFWRSGHGPALSRGDAFHLILQPDDIAQMLDDGPTTNDKRANLMRVPPIWRDPGAARLTRAQALHQLSLDPSRRYALVSLGSMVNFDLGALPTRIVQELAAREVVPVLLRSPLEPASDSETGARRLAGLGAELRNAYPVSPLLAAFDFAVSAAGYNSFHEFIAEGLPTIWVPNEAGEMDRQDLRAHFAHIAGAGLVLKAGDDLLVGSVLDQMLQPQALTQMRVRCKALVPENGARMAARLLLHLSSMVVMKQPD
jgi:UDP:flavonoid glycosyltransferase YjiC (YdhE family)